MSDFLWSVKNGDLDQVKDHIEKKGVSVNEVIDGRLPIHHAADYGQSEIVLYLLEHGADVNSVDKHGISALLAAIWEGHVDCVRLMLAKGASKQGSAPDGTSYVDAADTPELKSLLKGP